MDTVAYLQAVATWVFEKDGVIGLILPSGTFYVSRARAGGNHSEPIYFRGTVHPERDSVLICYLTGNSVTPKNFAGPLSGAAAA